MQLKKYHFIFILSLLVSPLQICFAGGKEKTDLHSRNTLYLELGGYGGLGSFNFDRIIAGNDRTQYSFRGGLSFVPGAFTNAGTPIKFIIPVGINVLIGKESHHLTGGFGQTLVITSTSKQYAMMNLNIGYRFQSHQGGLFAAAGYTPLISYMYNLQYQHWGGISIGYTFKK